MANNSYEQERKEKGAETIKKRQQALKNKIISRLKEQPIIQVAVAKAGADRSTYYRWIKEDGQFKKDCEEAMHKGVEMINDMMESLIIKSAREGKVTPMIFWLKNNHPKYSDQRFFSHEHHVHQDGPLTPERLEEIAISLEQWSKVDPDEDERDEDYELPNEYLDNLVKEAESKKTKKVNSKEIDKDIIDEEIEKQTSANVPKLKKATLMRASVHPVKPKPPKKERGVARFIETKKLKK